MTFYKNVCAKDDVISTINSNAQFPELAYSSTLKGIAPYQQRQRYYINTDKNIPKNCVNIDCDDKATAIGYCLFSYLKLYSDNSISDLSEYLGYIPYCEKCTYKYHSCVNSIDKQLELIIFEYNEHKKIHQAQYCQWCIV